MSSFPLPLWLATLQVVAAPTTWVPKWTALPLTCVNLRGNQHNLGGLSRLNQCLLSRAGWGLVETPTSWPGSTGRRTKPDEPPSADC